MSDTITIQEIKSVAVAWGGTEKFARVLGVSTRTVSYWLAGRNSPSVPVTKLIRSLTPPTGL